MDISLMITIASTLAAGGVFLVRTTGEVFEKFEKLQDRVSLEELSRRSEVESIRKEIDYKFQLHSQHVTMQNDRLLEILANMQKQIAGLERTIEALYKRLDSLYCDIGNRND